MNLLENYHNFHKKYVPMILFVRVFGPFWIFVSVLPRFQLVYIQKLRCFWWNKLVNMLSHCLENVFIIITFSFPFDITMGAQGYIKLIELTVINVWNISGSSLFLLIIVMWKPWQFCQMRLISCLYSLELCWMCVMWCMAVRLNYI